MKSLVIDNNLRADWYIRLANVVIDILAIYVFAVIFMVFMYLLEALGVEGPNLWIAGFTDNDFNILGLIIMIIYYAGMEITLQRTIGKMITGTIVIDENGLKPSPKAIIGRSFCRIFWIESISFLRAYPRGWHDSASGTYVVKAKKYKKALEAKDSFEQIGTEQI
jgi:uncharacterized RDD family membrane protein YckC